MSTPVAENIGAALESALDGLEIPGFGNLQATRMKRFILEGEPLDDLACYILQDKCEFQGDVIVVGGTEPRLVTQNYLVWVACLQGDKATQPIDQKLHVVVAEIVAKLCADYTLGGTCKQLDITEIQPTDSPEVGVLITVQILYFVQWNNPYNSA